MNSDMVYSICIIEKVLIKVAFRHKIIQCSSCCQVIRQVHSAAKDQQALNKVASQCCLLHPETTVRIPREKTRYTTHQRTPIYFHCRTGGVKPCMCVCVCVWREERECEGSSNCRLHECDRIQKTRSHIVHVIIMSTCHVQEN